MLYEAADAEDKAKMDDYAEFCAYLDEHEAMDEEELARNYGCDCNKSYVATTLGKVP